VLFVALAGGGARQIASVSRSAKCLPRAFRANFWVRSTHSLAAHWVYAKGCINNQRNLQRPKAGRGGAAAEKTCTMINDRARRCAFPAKNESSSRSVCVHRVNVLERCLCMRLTETSRARQFAKPPESIKSVLEKRYNLTCGYLSSLLCRPKNERRRATFFLASADRLYFMLYTGGKRVVCASAVFETQKVACYFGASFGCVSLCKLEGLLRRGGLFLCWGLDKVFAQPRTKLAAGARV